jgi:hypothetical protein
MELFLPSLAILLLAVIVIFFLLPRLSPSIIVLIATGLLLGGIYHHFSLFWNEYRNSTWQDQLKVFAPGIMITLIVVYVLFSILMFVTSGRSLAAPIMPDIELPPANTATNVVTSTFNNIIQSVTPNNKKNNTSGNTGIIGNVTSGISNVASGITNAVTNVVNTITGNNKNRKNNVSKSFIETI